jgi:hypothetical protein
MTQESPVILCFRCRTPVKNAAKIDGEHYCKTCSPEAVRRWVRG